MDGLTHIYCGDGKGKTTAAIGLGVRACASGKKVLLLQFLKGNTSGERIALEQMNGFRVMPAPEHIKFTFQMMPRELEETALLCQSQLESAQVAAAGGDCNLLILDEIFGAIECNLLSNPMLIEFIKNKPKNLELVLTGRNPSPEILELADYVSEIRKIKHPYDRGVPARKGIEY